MIGRKPFSTSRRRLHGNPSRKPLNYQEPEPPSTNLENVPREIAGNVEATREWKRLAPMLQTIRQVTEADRAALIALTIEWSRYLEAEKKARRPRVIRVAKGGYLTPNPWLAIQRHALSACLKLWPELGLTPSSRSRVTMTDGPLVGGDNFSEFDLDPPKTPRTN